MYSNAPQSGPRHSMRGGSREWLYVNTCPTCGRARNSHFLGLTGGEGAAIQHCRHVNDAISHAVGANNGSLVLTELSPHCRQIWVGLPVLFWHTGSPRPSKKWHFHSPSGDINTPFILGIPELTPGLDL